jgi:hypothetical protein
MCILSGKNAANKGKEACYGRKEFNGVGY